MSSSTSLQKMTYLAELLSRGSITIEDHTREVGLLSSREETLEPSVDVDEGEEELYEEEESDKEESDGSQRSLRLVTAEGDIYSLSPKDFMGTAHNGRRLGKATNKWGGCYIFKNGKPTFYPDGRAPKASEFKIDNDKLYYLGSGGKWNYYNPEKYHEGTESC